jgi:hypothetical protein
MTFDRRFCEDLFGTLGRDDMLRHVYRVYLWRQALGFIYHSPLDEGAITGADLGSVIQTFIPSSDRSNGLDAERAVSSPWWMQSWSRR